METYKENQVILTTNDIRVICYKKKTQSILVKGNTTGLKDILSKRLGGRYNNYLRHPYNNGWIFRSIKLPLIIDYLQNGNLPRLISKNERERIRYNKKVSNDPEYLDKRTEQRRELRHTKNPDIKKRNSKNHTPNPHYCPKIIDRNNMMDIIYKSYLKKVEENKPKPTDKIKCDCSKRLFMRKNLKKHCKSKKHIEWVKSKE